MNIKINLVTNGKMEHEKNCTYKLIQHSSSLDIIEKTSFH
jgi:hypothetical protein